MVAERYRIMVNLSLKGIICFFALAIFAGSCTSLNQIGGNHKSQQTLEKEKNEALIKKYEDLIGKKISKRKSLPLYRSVDNWMGVPYHYGSMAKNGTDCSGFVCSIYKEVYKLNLDRSAEEQYQKDVRRIRKYRLKEGDLVFFETIKGNKASHVGIYLGNHKFVHASVKKGVCIDDMTQKYYVDHFTRAGRVQKMKLKAALIVNGV